eukprot:4653022-Alexandrium_andersonii.AAC.1
MSASLVGSEMCIRDRADVVGIFKKGGYRLPQNYRPISLLEAAYKLLCRVVATRLQRALNGVVNSTQYGFMAERSTLDAITVVRRAIELVEPKPTQAVRLIFIDWEKAFDKIHPQAV